MFSNRWITKSTVRCSNALLTSDNIIPQYPFWQMTAEDSKAVIFRKNKGKLYGIMVGNMIYLTQETERQIEIDRRGQKLMKMPKEKMFKPRSRTRNTYLPFR